MSLKQILVWTVRGGVGFLLFTPLILSTSLFFPFITGKGFFFRIVTEIVFAAWLALAILYREYQPQKSILFVVLGAFTTSLTVSTIFGVDPYHSFWSNFERMEGLITHLHLFALFVAVAHTLQSKKEWFVLLVVSLGVSVLVGLYGVCEHFFYNNGIEPVTGMEKFCTNGSGGGRIYATFGNFIYLAVYTLFHMFFAAIAAVSVKDSVVRRALLAVLFFNAYIFYLAGSRGPIVGLFIALLVMTGLYLLLPTTKRYRLSIGLFLGALILSPFIFLSMRHTAFVQNSLFLNRLAATPLENIQNQPRVKIWGMGINSLAERPLFGWGMENFIVPYAAYYNPTLHGNEPWFDRIHNMSLEWLVMGGVVTFVLHIVLLVCVFYSLFKLVKDKYILPNAGILFVGMVIAYTVQNLFVFDTITNYIFFFLLLGFLHSGFVIHAKTVKHSAAESIHIVGAAFAILLVAIVGVWLNAKPLLAARYLSQAMGSISTAKKSEDITGAFQKVEALETFGNFEARERLADLVIQSAVRGGDPKLLMPVLDAAISSVEQVPKESASAKHFIMLGKLYTIRAHWTGKDKDLAEQYYKKALELAPHYPPVYLGTAELYMSVGDKKNALITIDKVFAMVPDSGSLFDVMLSTHITAQDFAGAGRLFEEHIVSGKLVFYHPVSHTVETNAFLQRLLRTPGDTRERLAFLKILEKKIEHPLLSVAFAQTYADLGNRAQARSYAEKALTQDPSLKDQVEKFIASLGAL